jgi:hypothetical protein
MGEELSTLENTLPYLNMLKKNCKNWEEDMDFVVCDLWGIVRNDRLRDYDIVGPIGNGAHGKVLAYLKK